MINTPETSIKSISVFLDLQYLSLVTREIYLPPRTDRSLNSQLSTLNSQLKAMLMLIFYVGNDRYALDTSNVVEVIPMVILRDIPHAPDYVAGLFNYRGTIVPAIDLCRLIKGTPSRSALSTRIIMVNYHHHNDTVSLVGLMAERIADTLRHTDVEFVNSGFQPEDAPYLGEMIVDHRGMIQRIQVENLLPESQRSLLLPGSAKSGSLEFTIHSDDQK